MFWLNACLCIVELEVFAVMRDVVFGPKAFNDFQSFYQAANSLPHFDAHRLELFGPIAKASTEDIVAVA